MHEITSVDSANVLETEQQPGNPVMKYFVWMKSPYGPRYATVNAEQPFTVETKDTIPKNVVTFRKLEKDEQDLTIDQLKEKYPCPPGD